MFLSERKLNRPTPVREKLDCQRNGYCVVVYLLQCRRLGRVSLNSPEDSGLRIMYLHAQMMKSWNVHVYSMIPTLPESAKYSN